MLLHGVVSALALGQADKDGQLPSGSNVLRPEGANNNNSYKSLVGRLRPPPIITGTSEGDHVPRNAGPASEAAQRIEGPQRTTRLGNEKSVVIAASTAPTNQVAGRTGRVPPKRSEADMMDLDEEDLQLLWKRGQPLRQLLRMRET